MILIRNQLHIAFFTAALAITISILLLTLLKRRTEKAQHRWFLFLLFIIAFNSLSQIFTAYFEITSSESIYNQYLLLLSQNTYFIFHTALCPALYNYVCSVTGKNRRRDFISGMLLQVPFFITEIIALSNPFTNWVFYYDSNNVFHRNTGEYFIYWAAIFYFVLAFFEILFSWKALTHRKSVALIYFFFIVFIGVWIQYKFINIRCELLAEALGMMGAMLAVENEDDRIDAGTRLYNRRAFQMDVHNMLVMNEHSTLIFVKILNANKLERIARSSNYDLLILSCAEFFKSLIPAYQIYHPTRETFVLICSKNESSLVEKLITTIENRFSNIWELNDSAIKLDANVFQMSIPGDLKNIDDIMYISDCIVPSSVANNNATIEWIMRRSDIEKAIRKNIANDGFEVYYQPTIYMKDFKLHGAEALIRMKDKELGYISPEEFIPIAEQIGMVEQIDDYVLREVCNFIKENIQTNNIIDCINVNLSVVQCLKPGFFKHITNIVDEYNIDYSMINFEITETVGAEDYDILATVAHKLKSVGFSISMDDYGTGYSNMEGIFSLDFNVIKIDKTLLWNAENHERGRIILNNTVKMIHDLGCEILVEGVETEKHVKMLQDLNVDYLQGYYFSKPIPKAQFIEYMQK
ncbi:EAL domain, c-di-GMP-specific phosphodiesterase class I (or its enzymatically inactive variant) [Pseudobutyrivibrio sp. C4]|nr:EAL domain, c-di-GMP-specific phosphodiesterase class I (or its enzymatically inactive variant) [Pseudobutyrivibrio sp. C4]